MEGGGATSGIGVEPRRGGRDAAEGDAWGSGGPQKGLRHRRRSNGGGHRVNTKLNKVSDMWGVGN